VSTYELAKDTKIVCVEHHLAHAASAYYTSGFSGKCLIITADGIGGDGVSLGVWRGENGKIEPLLRVGREGSLGWFYGTVTEALGWRHSDGEGKTMGLAPYGDFSKTEGILNKFCPHYNGGKLVTPHDFGRYKYWKVKGAYHWHFEDAKKIRELLKKYKREDIAAEAQRVFEREMMDIILSWLKKEGTTKLCCSGGAFLNIKLNQRIWESGQVTHQHIFPNAGDGGLPIGQALWAHYYLNGSSEIGVITNVYWGPEFDDKEIEVILKERNLNYKYYDDVVSVSAKLLAEGKILGWFQGRMESGPRALGNRSILMDPGKKENKDIINERVKFREPFRPFCPSLPVEAADNYLENWRMERYMITSFKTMDETRNEIPAVVHVDGTLRPQIVERDQNEKFWRLLTEFGRLTGTPVLLNTSFNIKGEPIVCTPRDAIRCFYDTGMDYLVMGNFIISK
jgi:carbamoyltransferase